MKKAAEGKGAISIVEFAPDGQLWDIPALAKFLMKSDEAVRGMMRRRAIPDYCIVKVGYAVRFIPTAIVSWLQIGQKLEKGGEDAR